MRVVVTSDGSSLDAAVSPVFGRCQTYVFVDTDTMRHEAVANPAAGAPGGAGIQAAQFIVQRGTEAIVTGNVGPNAFSVLRSAGIPVYLCSGPGTVQQAVDELKEGKLQTVSDANVPGHFGSGGGMGRGPGRGMGGGRRT
jgi:predicted Fe-Mo cluster-binding NifX family protein